MLLTQRGQRCYRRAHNELRPTEMRSNSPHGMHFRFVASLLPDERWTGLILCGLRRKLPILFTKTCYATADSSRVTRTANRNLPLISMTTRSCLMRYSNFCKHNGTVATWSLQLRWPTCYSSIFTTMRLADFISRQMITKHSCTG